MRKVICNKCRYRKKHDNVPVGKCIGCGKGWTDKKPTESGLYVFRSQTACLGQLIKIEIDDEGVFYWLPHHRGIERSLLDGLWFGPLPEIPK